MSEQRFDSKQWLDAIDLQWNAHNLEGALASFTDDAVVRMIPSPPGAQGTYSGKAEIRAWIASLFDQNFHVDSYHHQLRGNTVSWLAHAHWDDMRRLGVDPFTADCEALVEDGKMQQFIINVRPETLERLQAAMAQAGS